MRVAPLHIRIKIPLLSSAVEQSVKHHNMRYHDYHINEYRVSDRGETITFDLVFGYPENVTDQSTITFSEVALYNFVHTNNAIVTDIYEVSIADLFKEIGPAVIEWNRMHGVKGFNGSSVQYIEGLQSQGYVAWCIESAIGFYGFIIAKAVKNA